MKRFCLLFMLLMALSACDKGQNDTKSSELGLKEQQTQSADALSRANNDNNAIRNSESEPSTVFLAKNEQSLSVQDYETAYKMTTTALSQYYKAIWNNAGFDADAFFLNENLKQYTNKKIKDQYDLALKHDLTSNIVTNVEFETDEVKLVDDTNQYLYLKLKAAIQHDVGGYGEVTEFLVQNQDGKLVIVDWYCGAKDSYDMSVRGVGEVINNPNIWDDREWIDQIKLNTPTNEG